MSHAAVIPGGTPPGVFGVGPVEYTDHGDKTDSSNGTSYDFTSVTTTRKHSLIMVSAGDQFTGRSISSVIIDPAGDNVSMTELLDFSATVNARSYCGAFYIANKVISNKTVRVSVTPAAVNWCAITIVSLDNLILMTAEDTDVDSIPISLSLDAVPSGGIAFAAASSESSTAFSSWSPLTEIADVDPDNDRHGVAVQKDYDGSAIVISGPTPIRAGAITLR